MDLACTVEVKEIVISHHSHHYHCHQYFKNPCIVWLKNNIILWAIHSVGHVQGKGCLKVGADSGCVELNTYAFREGTHFKKNKYKFEDTKLSIIKHLFGMKK